MKYNSSAFANDWFHVVACGIEKKDSLIWKTFGCAGLGDPRLLLLIGDFSFNSNVFQLQRKYYDSDLSKIEKMLIESSFHFNLGLTIHFDFLRCIIFTHGTSKTIEFLIKIHGDPTQWLGEAMYYIMINFDPKVYASLADVVKKSKGFCMDIFIGQILRIHRDNFHDLVDKNHLLECIRIGSDITDEIRKEYLNLPKEKSECYGYELYQYGMHYFPEIFMSLQYSLVIITIELFYNSREEILKIGGFSKTKYHPLREFIDTSDLQRFPKFLEFATEFEFQNKDFQTTVKNAAERARTNPPSYY